MGTKESLSVVQRTVAATSTEPEVYMCMTLLYPSTSIMLWVSTSGRRMGSMSMSLPMTSGPAAVTRLQGVGSTSDAGDRLVKLLCT